MCPSAFQAMTVWETQKQAQREVRHLIIMGGTKDGVYRRFCCRSRPAYRRRVSWQATEHFKTLNEEATIITSQKLNHPGGCYGLRIERKGKVLVICTDVEHGDQIDPLVVKLAQGADLLVHDAQYTSEELPQRRGWGHSSYDEAMQVAEKAGVKRVAMTHHDPDHDDEFLLRLEKLCQERFKECVVAREGTELEL